MAGVLTRCFRAFPRLALVLEPGTMKIITLFSVFALAAITSCERTPTSVEIGLEDLIRDMESEAREKDAELQRLTEQLEMTDAKNRQIGELAKLAHSKIVDVNIAALEVGSIENPEVKRSAAMLLIMKNEAAEKACDDLIDAIEAGW